jgi:hypothetical protein
MLQSNNQDKYINIQNSVKGANVLQHDSTQLDKYQQVHHVSFQASVVARIIRLFLHSGATCCLYLQGD